MLDGDAGTYRIASNRIWVTVDGETTVFAFRINGNRMTVSGGDLDRPLVLTRQGRPQQYIQKTVPRPPASTARTPTFLTHQTPTVRFGYPQGWQITPIQGGYYITEAAPNVPGPGYLMMGGPATRGITSSAAVANGMVQWLRMNIPTMTVVQQSAHPRVSGALRLKLSYTQGPTRFESVAFAHLNNGNQFFLAFYAPQNRTNAFDMDAMILGVIGPMYGLQSGLSPNVNSNALYQELFALQQAAAWYHWQGLPAPWQVQQRIATLQQQIAGLARKPPAGSQQNLAKLQSLQRRLTELPHHLMEGRFREAERLGLEVYDETERLLASLPAAPAGAAQEAKLFEALCTMARFQAAKLLKELYLAEQRHDRFLEWLTKSKPLTQGACEAMRVVQAFFAQAAPEGQVTAITPAVFTALIEASDALSAADVHLAMRETTEAFMQADIAEQIAARHDTGSAQSPLRLHRLRAALLKAWVLATSGKAQAARDLLRQVERDLPSLEGFKFSQYLTDAMAGPTALDRLPPQDRAVLQAFFATADGAFARFMELTARQFICLVCFKLGEDDRAYNHARQIETSLPVFRQAFARVLDAAQRAEQSNQQYRALRLHVSNRFATVPPLACVAKAAFRVRRHDEAERLLKEIQADPNAANFGDVYWECQYLMGRLAERKQNLEAAQKHYTTAVDAIERTRESIRSDMTKVSFLGGERNDAYARLIALLVRTDRFEAAFSFAERAKSRALVDLLAGRQVGRTAGERTQVAAFQQECAQMLVGSASSERGAAPDLADDPDLASLQTVHTLSPAETRRMLPRDVTLLEYYVTSDRLYVWAISQDRFLCKSVSVTAPELTELVRAHRRALVAGDNIRGFAGVANVAAAPPTVSSALYDLLVAPVRSSIETSVVGIVPHGVLHYVPFCSLNDGQRYLIEDVAVFRAPSATVLEHVYRRAPGSAGTGLLAFGNPDLGNPQHDLRFAEEEVRRITAGERGAKRYTRANASETRFRQEAGRGYGAVHFACHGVFDAGSPLRSALLLAPDNENDGRLTARELFNTQLRTSLVTLSACQTGLAKITPGDDLVGLMRGFIFAGASTVVASLWSVDDRATSVLMERFYENLKRHPKAEALRQAQLTTMQDFRHPGYWAAFTLTGDGR